jgi:hypothetical protein
MNSMSLNFRNDAINNNGCCGYAYVIFKTENCLLQVKLLELMSLFLFPAADIVS